MSHFKRLSIGLFLFLAACATQASPDDMRMANNLCMQGKTLLAAGKTNEARDVYASATHRDDQNARAWNGLGVSLDLLGKRNEAEDAYKQAIDLAPGDLTAINNLAHLYLATGDADDAVRLLEEHENDPGVTPTFKQNLVAARKAAQLATPAAQENYADLGYYPTDGMAQAHVRAAEKLLDSDSDIIFSVIPEVKIAGGTPVFTVHATGKAPQDICDMLNPQAFPCVTHGK
jgi:tetratricopeptide (TPR) repeat protein